MSILNRRDRQHFIASAILLGLSLTAFADDLRRQPLKDLDGCFPFAPPRTLREWEQRKEYVRRQILVAAGLWPMPTKTPLNVGIHGKIDCDGYTVEKVYFEWKLQHEQDRGNWLEKTGTLLDYRDPVFLPGGAKYLDLPGLLALHAPRPLWLAGEGQDPALITAAYRAASSADGLVTFTGDATQQEAAAGLWLLK